MCTRHGTRHNRQGGDVGSQYRSAVWVSSSEQRQAFDKWLVRLSSDHTASIVTEVNELAHATFHPAEEYHQRYV